MNVQDHRDQLRKKYRQTGASALNDAELLELLLFRLKPNIDAKRLAEALLNRFGSISGVLGAPAHLLYELSSSGKSVAHDIKLLSAIGQRALRNELQHAPILASSDKVLDYCRAMMQHEQREQLRILFLNKRLGLIADEVHGWGTVDHIPVYPREVVRRALELSASSIILAHNHPSGDPAPSNADIQMTRLVVRATETMGIAVQDHIIIGQARHCSMKGLGLF
jgi:DNA repair protein RadC